jgi:Ca-activated chloride channel family protein
MRAQDDEIIKRRGFEQRRDEENKLARVIRLWQARLAWWRKRYRYPQNYRYGAVSGKKGRPLRSRRPRRRRANRMPSPAPMMAKSSVATDRLADLREAPRRPAAEAKDKKKKPQGGGRRAPSMKIKAWDPQTPYLAAIKQAAPARQYAVYLAQRKTHGSAPAFYLDCANYFFRSKQKPLAIRILSNLAELELENPALLRVLAHRLAQLGRLELAVQVFNEVLRLRKEEPQSYRDLALVLERLADRQAKRGKRKEARENYRRALDLLGKVVMERWDRFAEIEVIALTELNNILPKARRLGLREVPVDSRLLKKLTMDIRIVMTWDADSTDMDLHVVEPSGEEAYYSHNRTRIGGMVTRDFTRGYGPEVYAIRRAMPGRYTIRTKFFGSSAAKLAGAVTLQVDVYTNYGRRNQKRRSITLRLTKRKETFTVGTIRF